MTDDSNVTNMSAQQRACEGSESNERQQGSENGSEDHQASSVAAAKNEAMPSSPIKRRLKKKRQLNAAEEVKNFTIFQLSQRRGF